MTVFWDHHIDGHKHYIRSYGEGEGSATLQRLFKYIDPSDSVLDIGCGGGCVYGQMKELGGNCSQYKGVDYSERFIEACRELFPEGNFEIGDARDLSRFEDNSFDVVILKDVLQYIPLVSYEPVIKSAARIARKRVVVVNWHDFRELNKSVEKDLGDDGWATDMAGDLFMSLVSRFGTVRTDEEHKNRSHWYYIIDL
jgi:ubiquinone/menaquinone biosynthesis C-methylase UbiE